MVAVFGLFVWAVLGFYRRAARARGLEPGETGAITFVQRFGSSANLYIHAHVLVMDGVFSAADSGEVASHKLPAPSDHELQSLLSVVRQRVLGHLSRHGWLDDTLDATDPVADQAPVLAACYKGSVASRQTLGKRPGAPLQQLGADPHKRRADRPPAWSAAGPHRRLRPACKADDSDR